MWPLLLLALAGAGASYAGQQKAGDEERKVMQAEMQRQNNIRGNSLKAAQKAVVAQAPEQLQKDIQTTTAPTQVTNQQGQQLAQAFADKLGASGDASFKGAISSQSAGASNDSTASNNAAASSRGLANALTMRAQRMKQLGQTEDFNNYDSEQSQAMLPGRLGDAGRNGYGLRMAGGLASGIGAGGLNYTMWQSPSSSAAAGDTSTGMAGQPMTRTVDANGRVVWKAQQ